MSKAIDTLYEPEDQNKRPQVSYMIRKYIAGFITEEILEKYEYDMVVYSKMDTLLQMSFFLIQNQDNIIAFPSLDYKSKNTKAYPMMIAYTDRIANAPEVNIEFALLVYDAVCEFLTAHFGVESIIIEKAKSRLNLDYLASIVYPVPFSKQKFAGDAF